MRFLAESSPDVRLSLYATAKNSPRPSPKRFCASISRLEDHAFRPPFVVDDSFVDTLECDARHVFLFFFFFKYAMIFENLRIELVILFFFSMLQLCYNERVYGYTLTMKRR